MNEEGTARMVPARQALLDALAALASHSSKIHAAWRALLKTHEPCRGCAASLAGLRLAKQNLGPADLPVYQDTLERQGRDLAQRGVPVGCLTVAVDLYVETCLPYLLTGNSGQSERVLAFARWVSSCRSALLKGHTAFAAEERQSLKERIAATERRSQAFAVQLGEAYETERRRLAQDLHDEIGHDLIVLKLYTEVIALDLKKGDGGQVRRKLREAVKLIQHALKSVRRLTFDLGPEVWNEQGFVPAVRFYVRQFARKTRIKVRLDAARMHAVLPARCETALYKVLQGALANVAAHAHADCVKITLASTKERVVMKIEDDGKGFNVAHKLGKPPESYGLRAMRDRVELLGGAIHFESRPARRKTEYRGTTVEAHLPLHDTDIR